MVLRALILARNSHRLCNAKSPQPAARGIARRVGSAHRGTSNGAGAAMAGGAPQDLAPFILEIHNKPMQAVVWATGGGFQALAWLLTVPGASRTLLDARAPYSTAALTAALGGHVPGKFASPETAAAMAQEAYRSAAEFAAFGADFVGVACTAALVTDRSRRGENQVFVAVHRGDRCTSYAVTLAKSGGRDRAAEDALASRLLIRALAEAAQVTGAADVDLGLAPGPEPDGTEQLHVDATDVGDPLELLQAGSIRSVEYSGGQVVVDAPRPGRVYLPGSFNPLHGGHRQLLTVASKQADAEGCFELSIGNPDKGMLPLDQVRQRVEQFITADLPVVVVQAPLFTVKAKLYPRSTFVIGWDTAVRLVMPKYYDGKAGMLSQFAELRVRGCRFLVAGRASPDGTFKTLADIDVPEALQDLFVAIPEEAFRADISSTEIRQRAGSEIEV